ncbi:MAG TPA: hypothetical protein VE078_00250 [Thermoanaerobaculia bacterium]|nr:hypothetical protein [Thermoanaerobaculia bacterium]
MELSALPESTRRLFHGTNDEDLGDSPPFVIARLLEDGDSADLAWLCRTVSEPDLAGWLERRGGRQLSVRSRAFWEIVLDAEAGEEVPARSALWPL